MKRNYSIDLLRILAAMAVVVIHTVSGPVANYSGDLPGDLTANLHRIHNLMNWAVPAFFMITGYCILGKKTYSYAQSFSHVAKFVAVLFTVGLGYALLEEAAKAMQFQPAMIRTAIQNVIRGKLWDHMWYVYTIIGIYLVLPVIHTFLQTGTKNRFFLTALLFFFTLVEPAIHRILPLGIDIPFGGYLFYVCLGGMIAKGDFGKLGKIVFLLPGIAAAVWMGLHAGGSYGYRSLPVCMMAVGIFAAVTAMEIRHSRFIATVAPCTWGIYLLHPLFLNLAIKGLKWDLLSCWPYGKLALFGMGIFWISFSVTYILRKTL